MSSLVIFFVAMIAVIVPLNVVDSASAIDVSKILELIQQQQQNSGLHKQHRLQIRKDSSDSRSGSNTEEYFSDIDDTHESDAYRYARLKREKIIDLLEKISNQKNNRLQNDDRKIYRKTKENYNQKNVVSRNEKYNNSHRNYNIQAQILDELYSNGIINDEREVKPRADYSKKRLKPNRLMPKISKNELKEFYKNKGLDDYSKVYIVLNPQAVQKNKNKNSVNELLSKVLALSSPPSKNDRQGKRKPRRYKGFVVKDDHLSRRSRVSKEIYVRGSGDDDYKPKRSHGGGAGRTAIPYTGHRGNIYEKDN